MSIPHLFRCPISLDLFTDPVTLCTGQTYDRPCIERWLAAGHRTCPVTMLPLSDPSLVPNRTLRLLIHRWLSSSTSTDADEPPSLAALKRTLQSGSTANNAKAVVLAALKRCAALASDSDVGRACMLNLGFLPVLLRLVFHAPPTADHHQNHHHLLLTTELALQCLLTLLPPPTPPSPHHAALNMLRTESSLASFVTLLQARGRGATKALLCRLLETIATAAATRDLALAAAASPRVWHALLPLLLLRHSDEQVSVPGAAARAVAAICCAADEPTRRSAVHHGAVPALLACLSSCSSSAAGKGKGKAAGADAKEATRRSALAALEAVAGTEGGRRAVARQPGAVRALVRHVFTMSSRNEGSEHAAAALLAVCGDRDRECGAARAQALEAGVVTQALLLLQSQCGNRAKNRARALLKLFRSSM